MKNNDFKKRIDTSNSHKQSNTYFDYSSNHTDKPLIINNIEFAKYFFDSDFTQLPKEYILIVLFIFFGVTMTQHPKQHRIDISSSLSTLQETNDIRYMLSMTKNVPSNNYHDSDQPNLSQRRAYQFLKSIGKEIEFKI